MFRRCIVVFTSVLVLSLSFCGTSKPQGVIVVLLDAARPDRFGAYGYPQSPTPNIDRIARESLVFDHAYTVADYTLPSLASLWTGLQMKTHGMIGILDNESIIPLQITTLPELLQQNDIATALVAANPNLAQVSFQRGFQYKKITPFSPYEPIVSPFELVQAGFDWLKQQKSSFFLFIHLLQPHAPYTPPPEYISAPGVPRHFGTMAWLNSAEGFANQGKVMDPDHLRAVQELYNANLRWADAAVQDLYRNLKENGFLENTWLVIMSDHGEGFGEHLYYGHAISVYEESIRVPLIIHPPSGNKDYAPGRRDAWVYAQDLHPTILEWFNIKPPKGTEFTSLCPIIADPKLTGHKTLVSCTHNFGRCALIQPPWKLIVSREHPMHLELYRLPDERLLDGNLAPLEPKRLYSLYLRFRGSNNPDEAEVTVPQTEEWLEQLRALGYLGPGSEGFLSYKVYPAWLPSGSYKGNSRFSGWSLAEENNINMKVELENHGKTIWPSLSTNNEGNTVLELTFLRGKETIRVDHPVSIDIPPGRSKELSIPLPSRIYESGQPWNVLVEIGQAGRDDRYPIGEWNDLKGSTVLKFDSGFSPANPEATQFWMEEKGELVIYRPTLADNSLMFHGYIRAYHKSRRWIIQDMTGTKIAAGVARQKKLSEISFPVRFPRGGRKLLLSVQSLDGTTIPADVEQNHDIRPLSIRIEDPELRACCP